ncbi:hypothetical protein GCM10022398_16670 [Acetobacter lovaniensis]|nr:hypothetical protein AA0474_2560 [Acetobacter lovaniensis NRIC 0474]
MNKGRIYADVVAEYDREKVRRVIAFALKTYPEQWNNIFMNENGIMNCPGFCGDSKTREVRRIHEQ